LRPRVAGQVSDVVFLRVRRRCAGLWHNQDRGPGFPASAGCRRKGLNKYEYE